MITNLRSNTINALVSTQSKDVKSIFSAQKHFYSQDHVMWTTLVNTQLKDVKSIFSAQKHFYSQDHVM